MLIGEIKQNVKNIDNIINIGNNKSINFNDIINFLKDIMKGKINNSNKQKKYNEKSINQLKSILFTLKKLSGKGLTIGDLPILLSKIYTNNNNSKEMINEITQSTEKIYMITNK